MAQNKNITIIKGDGSKAQYDENKIERSLKRTGVDKQTIARVLAKMRVEVKEGMTTQEIFDMVHDLVNKEEPVAAIKYNLRKAITRLGPDGFDFEKYVAAILTAYGYNAYVPQRDLQGACVSHEIDVIAEKDGRRTMIEAKFRHKINDVVNIKDTMSTWARYLDLVDGSRVDLCPHFDDVWIITNARFTQHSLRYGHCKNMMMIGWNHPTERSFARMIDLSYLYPVTILPEISDHEAKVLAKHNILLCAELARKRPETLVKILGFKQSKVEKMISMCKAVIKKRPKKPLEK